MFHIQEDFLLFHYILHILEYLILQLNFIFFLKELFHFLLVKYEEMNLAFHFFIFYYFLFFIFLKLVKFK